MDTLDLRLAFYSSPGIGMYLSSIELCFIWFIYTRGKFLSIFNYILIEYVNEYQSLSD
jgi:hypothetical protein